MKKRAKLFLVLGLVLSSIFLSMGCGNKNTEEVKKETSQLKALATADLQENIRKDNWVVVDTRINDAFNGWALDGVARGGHITGAVDFAANWLKVDNENNEERLKKILQSKGITPEKNVVLYDANGKDAKEVASYLSENGFKNLYIYDVKEWAADTTLAMESYPNYEMVVPAEWVNDLIKTKNDGKPYKIFEASWGEESEDYNKGHIPGAVHINTDEVEEGPLWNRLTDDRLKQFALNNGITVDTTVVLYGADSMPAFRVAAILKYTGVKDVRVLNGGYNTWVAAGFEAETTGNKKVAVTSFGAKVPVNKDYIVDLAEAKEILADKEGSKLVDIRSWAEHIGKTSGYDYIKGKGRPPGAVWGHAGTDNSNLDDFRNPDNTMRNGVEILSMWEERGITPEQRLAFFCGTGWRAAEVLIYADVMGLKNISLYDGGWNEWSEFSNNPIETGEPK